MEKEVLIKFLNNSCTEAELNEVLSWAKTKALTEEGQKLGYEDWKNYFEEDNLEEDKKFISLFEKIQEKINRHNAIGKPGVFFLLPLYSKWFMRVAAILFLPVLALLFYTISENKTISSQYKLAAVDSLEVIAPIGSRTIVTLSDGSVVHLNYGSRIKYPQRFLGDAREVKLEGEGFFEVHHNPDKPFVVKTGKINIKAVGTSFNVHAYPEEDIVETVLVNGKVALETENAIKESEPIGSMLPGQHITFNTNTGEISYSKVDVEKYIAWKDGKLIFEDSPIQEVASKLSRMFNVDIQIDEDISDYFYTVTIMNEPLFQILDLMTLATPIQYKSFARSKLPDGTYSKLKIIVERRN
ncbi:DUF4974 domain-containing protein [Maribellus comscasis]|uniref:DUF4974 domain-containing protein n=1 Tax=Maribellus comscasis TaxID=2681766 RepID=A0A6I6JX43_9BACT|nr:FecR family protein [Maribellus comscasis]QGY47171.1 DUF4974 domain-containing protein [Maribellus comscasis]